MNYKSLFMSVLFAGVCGAASAQTADNYYTEKWTDNIFLGANLGAMTVFNDGMNTPTFHFDVQLGKYITPVWGTRLEVGVLTQSLDKQESGFSQYNKKFVEFNLDGMLNLTNLFKLDPARKFNVYAFAGPTANISKAVDANLVINGNGDQTMTYNQHGAKTRLGASAGLGLGYDVTDKLAINLEGRVGVTPSIFGNASDCRKAEATGRLTLGVAYTFGGKTFKKVADRVIEKEVVREIPVEKIVEKEVVKEVKVEGKAVAAAAVFFKIGKTDLSEEGKVNIKLIADAIKKSANVKYQVAGSADKKTGSAALNQKLSEKRAQVVYDALIAEGVNPSQLEIVAKGGVDPLFFGIDKLSRVTVIECK